MTTPFIHDAAERQIQPGRTIQLSPEAQTFNWLLDSFTSGTAGVLEAVAVSSDGLLMAMSATRDRANAERLAAVVSGITSLSGGAAHWYSLGGLNRVIVDLANGYLLITSISAGSVLGVIADRSANLGAVAYERTLLASRARRALRGFGVRARARRPVAPVSRRDQEPGRRPARRRVPGRARPGRCEPQRPREHPASDTWTACAHLTAAAPSRRYRSKSSWPAAS